MNKYDKEVAFKEWLGKENVLGWDILNKKYRYNNESFDEWLERVSGGDKDVKQLVYEKKFLFGGRVLANRGVKGAGSYYNCNSDGYVPDDMNGIMETAKTLALTYKAQGGQGVSLSKIRPKGTNIGNNYKSDGIIPFMRIFNTVTESISMGGNRKGALMLSLDITHKDAKDFITIKTDLNEINKANLSLEINDEFMVAVDKYYQNGEVVTLHQVKNYNGHIIEYDIKPIELYKLMMETVYDYGEPGCLFTDVGRNYNLVEFLPEAKPVTVNPCGEQWLGAKFSCNLGSINLFEFVQNPFTPYATFDFDEFEKAITIAVEALDNIIDENLSRIPIKEYRDNSIKYRNIGLGVFGYADMLIAMQLKYGSEEAINFTSLLFQKMIKYAIEGDIQLADKKGSFPNFDNSVWQTKFFNEAYLKPELKEKGEYIYKNKKLRNCSLLSIAPTGSIGTMFGRSGGIEPQFAFEYTRRTDNLAESYKVYADIVNQYKNLTSKQNDSLPDYFIASQDVRWQDRLKTQAAIQKYIDTAISSTVNLPAETTLKEIEQLYLEAWKLNLKGITIFRDKCKRLGILLTDDENNNNKDNQNQQTIKENKLPRGYIITPSDDLLGCKRTVKTGCGKFYIHADFDESTGEMLETFIDIGSGGGCERNLQFESRLMSTILRLGGTPQTIIDQAESVKPCKAYTDRTKSKGDTSKGTSCPSAIGWALKELDKKIKDRCFSDCDIEKHTYKECECDCKISAANKKDELNTSNDDLSESNKCPECGNALIHEAGCVTCYNCGYSKC